MNSEPKRRTYGARFLDELRSRLRSTGGLRYEAIQLLEGAEREEFGQILRRELTGLTYAVNTMIEEAEPETVAEWFAQELENEAQRRTSAVRAAAFFLLMR